MLVPRTNRKRIQVVCSSFWTRRPCLISYEVREVFLTKKPGPSRREEKPPGTTAPRRSLAFSPRLTASFFYRLATAVAGLAKTRRPKLPTGQPRRPLPPPGPPARGPARICPRGNPGFPPWQKARTEPAGRKTPRDDGPPPGVFTLVSLPHGLALRWTSNLLGLKSYAGCPVPRSRPFLQAKKNMRGTGTLQHKALCWCRGERVSFLDPDPESAHRWRVPGGDGAAEKTRSLFPPG
ncbi:hypothetical protein ES703_60932 [subsurface metagenome]